MSDQTPPALALVTQSVQNTRKHVFGNSAAANQPIDVNDVPMTPAESVARTAQSVGQTTAIVIQDAGDMLRNVSTVEVTAIGAATAAWIATKDPLYKEIITTSMSVMQDAAALYLTIGQNAFTVLKEFK